MRPSMMARRKKRKSVSAKQIFPPSRISTTLVLQHGHFWRLYHLRHPQLLHQLPDGNVRYVAGGCCRAIWGLSSQKSFRAICGRWAVSTITTYSRVKSPTRVIQLLPSVGVLARHCATGYNSKPAPVAMGIGLILLLGFTCYASRGLLWAAPAKRGPGYIMGTTVGICSVIGCLPDVFVYPIVGHTGRTPPHRGRLPQRAWLMGPAALRPVILFTFCCFRKYAITGCRDRTRGIACRRDCRRVEDENFKGE